MRCNHAGDRISTCANWRQCRICGAWYWHEEMKVKHIKIRRGVYRLEREDGRSMVVIRGDHPQKPWFKQGGGGRWQTLSLARYDFSMGYTR